jgi:hypothetical protein
VKGLVRGSAAIVGVAESELGAVAEGMSPVDLMAQGVYRALDDAGLKWMDSSPRPARSGYRPLR